MTDILDFNGQRPRPAPAVAALQVDGLTRRFGGLVAVDNVEFAVSDGSIHGLIGPNGAGKTTLFNMISGVIPPSSGSVSLLGRSLDGMPTYRRTALGMSRTFQNIRLFTGMTVLENVVTGYHSRLKANPLGILLRTHAFRQEEREARARALHELDLVGLSAAADACAGDLPYGDQRRLEIARALVSGPSLLLLDEPAAGMNPTETRSLLALLARLREEREITMLLVDHDMHFVMALCDRITVLNFGRKIADGKPEEVRAQTTVIEAYLGRKVARTLETGLETGVAHG